VGEVHDSRRLVLRTTKAVTLFSNRIKQLDPRRRLLDSERPKVTRKEVPFLQSFKFKIFPNTENVLCLFRLVFCCFFSQNVPTDKLPELDLWIGNIRSPKCSHKVEKKWQKSRKKIGKTRKLRLRLGAKRDEQGGHFEGASEEFWNELWQVSRKRKRKVGGKGAQK